FASPDGVAEIPFELHNNHINVRGRLGDSDSLWIVLDSGASGASVSASRARALGLPVTRGGTANGAGGSVESGRVSHVTIRLPGRGRVGGALRSSPVAGAPAQTGRPMDVILGHALLARAVVEIAYTARRPRVMDPKRATTRPQGTTLPLSFRQNLPYVQASV